MRIKFSFFLIFVLVSLLGVTPYSLPATINGVTPLQSQFTPSTLGENTTAFLHDGSNATGWYGVSTEGGDSITSTGGYLKITYAFFSSDTDFWRYDLDTPITNIDNLVVKVKCNNSEIGIGIWKLQIFNDTDYTDIYGYTLTQSTSQMVSLFDFDTPSDTSGSPLTQIGVIGFQVRDNDIPDYHFIDYIELYYTGVAEWHETSEAILYFNVPISEATLWALNGWYILAGLVLLPCGTMFLARTAKEKQHRSLDNVFYGIVIIFIGLALFIGGVVP